MRLAVFGTHAFFFLGRITVFVFSSVWMAALVQCTSLAFIIVDLSDWVGLM